MFLETNLLKVVAFLWSWEEALFYLCCWWIWRGLFS